MKYTVKQYRDSFPEWKKAKCGIVSRTIHRPISFATAAMFSNLSITPNQVSFISLIAALCVSICYLTSSYVMGIVGAIMMNIWLILDCSDGNMARLMGGQPYGGFIDATSSYFLYGTIFPAIGVFVYNNGGQFFHNNDPRIIYLGAITSISVLLSKSFYHKAMHDEAQSGGKLNVVSGNGRQGTSRISIIYEKINDKLLIGEWDMVLVTITSILNKLDIFIIICSIYFILEFIASFVFILYKTKVLQKGDYYK